MAEELGKIEKPPAEDYRLGRKLFFIPLLYTGDDLPEDYREKIDKYWEQVRKQIIELSSKLGSIGHIFHELIAVSGEEGCTAVKQLNEISYSVIQTCLDQEAKMEAVEDADILAEFMDWSRCLYIGLQNPAVQQKVYGFYTETAKKRVENIAGKLDEILRQDEIGILIMRENHQVQFPPDIQIFYVAPPALDEIKRWLREQEKSAGAGADGS